MLIPTAMLIDPHVSGCVLEAAWIFPLMPCCAKSEAGRGFQACCLEAAFTALRRLRLTPKIG